MVTKQKYYFFFYKFEKVGWIMNTWLLRVVWKFREIVTYLKIVSWVEYDVGHSKIIFPIISMFEIFQYNTCIVNFFRTIEHKLNCMNFISETLTQ